MSAPSERESLLASLRRVLESVAVEEEEGVFNIGPDAAALAQLDDLEQWLSHLTVALEAADARWQEMERPFDKAEYDGMFDRMTKAEASLREVAEIAVNRDGIYGDPILAIADRLAGELADEPLRAELGRIGWQQ